MAARFGRAAGADISGIVGATGLLSATAAIIRNTDELLPVYRKRTGKSSCRGTDQLI